MDAAAACGSLSLLGDFLAQTLESRGKSSWLDVSD